MHHGNADALSRRPCSLRDCACHTAEQRLEDASSGFIGGSADYLQVLGPSVVQSITDDRRKSITNTDETARDVPSWSHDGLCAAQQADPDIGFVIRLMENNNEKLEWEEVALSSQCVKTLWNQWTRLSIRDGLLKRRFEAADGLSCLLYTSPSPRD